MMKKRVAVVVPSYRVAHKVLGVINAIGPEVARIFVVDDCCPEGSGQLVVAHCHDPRVRVIFHEQNRGVGGATMTGFRAALEEGMEIAVKLDGDGQMDPALIPALIRPLLNGQADYCKGNRFFNPDGLVAMPKLRLIGNAVLSFLSKLSSGYWNVFDPTNGFVAIDARVLALLPLDKIDCRYFFESDMLFRLSTFRAKIVDMPMDALYADERSSLKVVKIIPEFLYKHLNRLVKRFVYNYLIRDFNIASLGLIGGLPLLGFGVAFGLSEWAESARTGIPVSSGTVMLAALPIIVGLQFLVLFLNYDINNVPQRPISGDLHV